MCGASSRPCVESNAGWTVAHAQPCESLLSLVHRRAVGSRPDGEWKTISHQSRTSRLDAPSARPFPTAGPGEPVPPSTAASRWPTGASYTHSRSWAASIWAAELPVMPHHRQLSHHRLPFNASQAPVVAHVARLPTLWAHPCSRKAGSRRSLHKSEAARPTKLRPLTMHAAPCQHAP